MIGIIRSVAISWPGGLLAHPEAAAGPAGPMASAAWHPQNTRVLPGFGTWIPEFTRVCRRSRASSPRARSRAPPAHAAVREMAATAAQQHACIVGGLGSLTSRIVWKSQLRPPVGGRRPPCRQTARSARCSGGTEARRCAEGSSGSNIGGIRLFRGALGRPSRGTHDGVGLRPIA